MPVPAWFAFIRCALAVLALSTLCALALHTPARAQAEAAGGPIRLRQPAIPPAPPAPAPTAVQREAPAIQLGEFEDYVRRLVAPREIKRFGAELLNSPAVESDALDASAPVPPDYIIQPGDEIVLTVWGSVDADLRLPVDRSGRINIPRVGSVFVAGSRHGDLADLISHRMALVFKNYQLSATVSQLRGIRVYVTGFVARPGSMVASSLSTMVGALLRAGGPSAAGSFRSIELRRTGQTVANLDFYDLLLKGDRSADKVLRPEDVIHVNAVGTQVALIGSVNRPGIFELKPDETAADLLRMAAGFSAVADRGRLAVERLDERFTFRVRELALPEGLATQFNNGDVVRVFSAVDAALPQERKSKRVRVEGEVLRPGDYVLPAASSMADAIQAAGGMTPAAYVYGTEFMRESVRASQQENYERALRELESDLTRYSTTQRTSNAEEAAAQNARAGANARLVERLRAIKPSGRVVLEMTPDAKSLPNLALEDGDRIYVPTRATTVGVFGSVFNSGSYLYASGRLLDEYLQLAGGPTKGADVTSAMVIRANGSVISGRQANGHSSRSGVGGVRAEAGDTVFVPEEMDKTTWVQSLKDWTQILANFGLGLAAIKSVTN